MARSRTASTNRRLLAVGIAVGLALLVVVGRLERHALAPHRSAAPPPAPLVTSTVVRPSPVAARLHLGPPLVSDQDTFRLAVGEGGVWALLHGSLVHVDPHNDRVTARLRLGRPHDVVGGLVVGAGAVWVGTRAGTVRVDPMSNRVLGVARLDPPIQLAGPDGLWSWRCQTEFGGPCQLSRFDPHTLTVSARIPLPPAAAAVAVGAGSAWVLGDFGTGLWRVDVASGRAARVHLPMLASSVPQESGGAIALGAGAVWVASDAIQTPTALGSRVGPAVVRIDPATMRVSAVAALDNLDQVQAMAVGAGSVWVQGRQPQAPGVATIAVDRVDATTARRTGVFDTQSSAQGAAEGLLAAGFGSVWLAQLEAGDLLRIDPARL